jgi:natural product biosynthesis luciferase-like monooxygenase protein/amino acid adenylation domain-containing protein/non-ribosomal peptide synthase protein (TIGR01720 family)
MDVIKFLKKLKANNITVSLDESNLEIGYDGDELPQEILLEIRSKKESIISFLKNQDVNDKQAVVIPKVPVQQHYKLSSSQKSLWGLSQNEEVSIAYNIPGTIVLEGELNLRAFEDAFKAAIARHETLRTVFREDEGGEVRQYIRSIDEMDFRIGYADFREVPDNKIAIAKLIGTAIRTPFNLQEDYLLRGTLYQLSSQKWIFNYVMHHIISDGWSMQLLLGEIFHFYNASVKGEILHQMPLRIQYKDYAAWQQQIAKEDEGNHRSFWMEKFKGELPLLQLPTDRKRPTVKSHYGKRLSGWIELDTAKKMKALSQKNGGTLFMSLLASVNTLLYRYSNQQDIIIGTPVSGRNHTDLEDQIGYFVNTIALRTKFNENEGFEQLLKEVIHSAFQSFDHQSYPFAELVQNLQLKNDISRSPLFDVMLVLHSKGLEDSKKEEQFGALKVSGFEDADDTVISKYDMVFSFEEQTDGIGFAIEFNTDLFYESTVLRMISSFNQLLVSAVNDPLCPLIDLEYVSAEDKQKLLFDFNDTNVVYPENKTLVDLFEEQVKKHPENIAVAFGPQALTYVELNERANMLAHYLRKKYKIKPDDLIGIKLERGTEMIISMIAVLKSGGAYVPIEPSYPEDRIEYIISDSKFKVLIDDEELSVFRKEESNYERKNLRHVSKPNHLAYVIYTSGTTGKPKGVLIEHRNVVRLFITNKPLFDFNSADVWTMFHSYCFDFSVWEMYGALLYGGKLVVIPAMVAKDTQLYFKTLKAEGVTILNQTPSAFYNLQDEALKNNPVLKIRYVIFGGESLNPQKLGRWKAHYPDTRLINMYGITETTVHVTYKEITEKEIESSVSNIGIPIPTLSCYVLDANRNLLPIGVEGELYVGGSGLARGYLNKPDLTQERFIKSPFGKDERLYKSGDRVRILASGEMEYYGRNDDQVKIRGYRIELGEIENVLLLHPSVRSITVLAKENKDREKDLVAYIVADEKLNASELRTYLNGKIPVYMLPAYFVQLDQLPLTSNGKVNKEALLAYDGIAMESGVEYVAPANPTEMVVSEIWEKLLLKEKIGTTESFFDIGGDSIRILRMMGELKNKLGLEVSVADIYKNSTIRQLSFFLNENKNLLNDKSEELLKKTEELKKEIEDLKVRIVSSGKLPDKENVEDIYPMSAIEKGMVFWSLVDPSMAMYHDQVTYRKHFVDFDAGRFKKALELLILKHPMLRTSFHMSDFETEVQIVHKNIKCNLDSKDLSGKTSEEQDKLIVAYMEQEREHPFNVAEAPLWRMTMFNCGEGGIAFVWQFHHAIIDGWSNASFITELNNLYLKLEEEPGYEPEKLKASYKDFIIQYEIDRRDENIKQFWQKELADYKRLDLFSEQKTSQSHIVSVKGADLKKLEKAAETLNTSVKILTLSAYLYMLRMLNSGNEVVAGLVTNTRPVCEDSENILGCFLNTVPLRIIIKDEIKCSEFVGEVSSKLLQLKEYERLSTLEMSIADQHKSEFGNPFFDVLFNYVDFYVYNDIEKDNLAKEEGISESSEFGNMENGVESTNTFLDITVNKSKEMLNVRMMLSRKFNSGFSLERTGELFLNILNGIISNAGQTLNMLDCVTADEKEVLLNKFNDTESEFVSEKTIVELFEGQVKKTPEKTALVFKETSYTYKELNEKANSFGEFLRKKYNIKPNDILGIRQERSEWMLVSILGILKSGAAYLPLDKDFPADRIAYIVEDSGCKAVVDEKELKDFFAQEETLQNVHLTTANLPDDLAYVIYTSGSTGKPKGVMVAHKNVHNFFAGMTNVFGDEPGTMLALTNYTFDISVLELLWTLTLGFKVVIQNDVRDLSAHTQSKNKALDFSLFYFGNSKTEGGNKYNLFLEGAKYADQNGYSAIWTPERHFNEFGGLYPSPVVLGAAISTITKNIGIRAGSVVVPLHHPARIAEEWSVIDNLSGGRVGIACASGWNANDFVFFPDNYKKRHEVMYQSIDIIQKLWKGDSIEMEDGNGVLKSTQILPRPIQKDISLWVTSSTSIDTFISAGKRGLNVLTHLLGETLDGLEVKIKAYRKAYTDNGHEQGKGKVALMLHTYIGEDLDKTYEEARIPFINYLKSSLGLIRSLAESIGINMDSDNFSSQDMDDLLDYSFRRYMDSASLVGTKETCMKMCERASEIGVDEIACLIDFGVDDISVLDSLKYLTELKDTYSKTVNDNSPDYSIHTQLKRHKVTHLQSTPSLATLLNSDNEGAESMQSLKRLLLGGERLPLSLVKDLYSKLPEVEIYNMYGPTETTIWSTCSKVERDSEKILIGKPIVNTKIYILNDRMKLLPLGLPGEIHIGGKGVAKKYINRPELSQERFIDHSIISGERLYKTGDYGRWLPDGNLEYIERKDDQVKIRGYRIELGEIENALSSDKLIEAAIVVARERASGDKELVAYIVSEKQFTASELRIGLSELLPVYMIPAHFIQLEALPLTPNGKIDKKALPDPEGLSISSGIEYTAPRNSVEIALAGVWAEVLGLDKNKISIEDNFFVLGGDSIKSILIVSRLKQSGYSLKIRDLLLYPSIKEVALYISISDRIIDQGIVEGTIPLSPVQKYFFELETPARHHYNQSVLLSSKISLNENSLKAALDRMVLHHDALRIVFRETAEGFVQYNLGQEQSYGFEIIKEATEAEFAAYCESMQSGINLEEGPLFKVVLFRSVTGDKLLLVAHHLVIDGVSWRILFEDLSNLYQQHLSGQALSLPLKSDSFKEWQNMLAVYSKTEELQKETAYWEAIENNGYKSLPKDNAAGSNLQKDTAQASFTLNENFTSRLLTQCYKSYKTEINDILLAGLGLVLKEVFAMDRVSIKMEGHGRESITDYQDITRTVGWFTSMYPVGFDLDKHTDIIGMLIEVKETMHRLPNKGIGYGILRYIAEKAYTLEPEIMFNYLGDFGSGLETGGGEKLFDFSGDYHGKTITEEMQREFTLLVSGLIADGKLNISISYSNKQYAEATIEKLMKVYQQQVIAIIERIATEEKEYLTPVDLSYKGLSLEQVNELNKDFNLEDVYNATPLQEGFYYYWAAFAGSPVFFQQTSFQLKGKLNVAAMEQSYHLLVARHSVLRTYFTLDYGERLLQVVKRQADNTFYFKELSGEKNVSIDDYKEEDRIKGFDLHHGSQIRLTILSVGNNTYELIWSNHHIVMDGWCMGILIREFFQIYDCVINNQSLNLDKTTPYSVYIDWLNSLDAKESLAYWKNYLAGYTELSTLPKAIRNNEGYVLREVNLLVDEALKQSIKNVCAESGVTENTFMQAAWGILLCKYNNVPDAVFGSVVSGRPPEVQGVENMVGLFINTIPVRVRVDEKASFNALVKEIQQNAILGADHHYAQLAQIQSESALVRDLFDHILVFENYPVQEMVENSLESKKGQDDLSFLSSGVIDQNNYDLTVAVHSGNSIVIKFMYNENVYMTGLIGQVKNHLLRIMQQVVKNPYVLIKEIDYHTKEEKQQMAEDQQELVKAKAQIAGKKIDITINF